MNALIPTSGLQLATLATLIALVGCGLFITGVKFANAEYRRDALTVRPAPPIEPYVPYAAYAASQRVAAEPAVAPAVVVHLHTAALPAAGPWGHLPVIDGRIEGK